MSGLQPPFVNVGLATRLRATGNLARKLLVFALVTATVCVGVGLMFDILSANGTTLLEAALLLLFSITFSWIVIAFWSGAIGFVLQMLRLDPLSLRRHRSIDTRSLRQFKTRTAIVMPVYNEETARIMAGFEANLRSLANTGQLDAFDFFMLSDTQDPELIKAELAGWHAMTQRLGELAQHAFYRRREKNSHRKVGNLADFCQRWGAHYEHMVILDADSIMTGTCVLTLVATMEANPQAGLIQTVPIPVRQTTLFGRFLQFAAALNSPMLATGLAFWQTDSANYWGHNAIIRVDAFLESCGLPSLPGKGAFSGDILSHDFVEAALLRRAGWDVFLLAELEGSYEEVPSNLLDYATRDRRWVQGNIQHLALLHARGLHAISRLHFLFGAVAYISTLVWLLMLALSTVDALMRAATSNVFFSSGYQLFPDWQIAKTDLIFSMLYLTAALLLLPKLMSLVVALTHRRHAFGGTARLLASTFTEVVFAILIAPLMMVFHSYFVICVFLGRKVNWNAQSREGRMIPWGQALHRTALVGLIAIAWGGITYFYAPVFFWWLTPVITGLVLAAPIVRYSSSFTLGRLTHRWGLFLCPSETSTVPILHDLAKILPQASSVTVTSELPSPALPNEQWREMPIQSFRRWRPNSRITRLRPAKIRRGMVSSRT
jgi:membrane glycosyltransferase